MPYQTHLFDASGNRVAILQDEILPSCNLDLAIDSAPTLTLSTPYYYKGKINPKVQYISPLYYAKIWSTNTEEYEFSVFELYNINLEDSESNLILEATYQGVLKRLSKEYIDSYDTGSSGASFSSVITALLAFQINTPAITVGTIEPTNTVAIAVESSDIYSALNSIRDAYGGWFEVDASYNLNWYNDNTNTPDREIRRKKNLKGITVTPGYDQIVNRVYAYGNGEGDARITLLDAGESYEYIEDSTSISTYGTRAKKYIDATITHPTTLLNYAQRILAEYKDPPYQYSIDMVNLAEVEGYTYDLESLGLDTRVRVIDSLLSVDINTSIVSMSINLLAPEEISIELSTIKNDLSDLFGEVLSVQDVYSSVATQIGAGQVTVLGTFTVNDWRTAGTTTIDGGNITANTITTTKLNFTPVESTNVIASINSSSEGITISASKITLAGVVSVTNDIQSSNYSAGSTGWIIDGDGSAEFNNVTVRGTLAACSINAGETLTLDGTINASDEIYIDGPNSRIKITGSGELLLVGTSSEINIMDSSETYTYISLSQYTSRWRNNSGVLTIDIDRGGSSGGFLQISGGNIYGISSPGGTTETMDIDMTDGSITMDGDLSCDDVGCDDINCGGQLNMTGSSGNGRIYLNGYPLYASGSDLYWNGVQLN